MVAYPRLATAEAVAVGGGGGSSLIVLLSIRLGTLPVLTTLVLGFEW